MPRHTVKFEPVEIEIEVSEDETILEAGFRQGIMLAHGCKEGQCSACKSFLLSGEVDLERYSTFALADYEREEGYTLLCRAHAYSDIQIPDSDSKRSFSMSNTPAVADRLEFMIKVYPGGRFSSLLAGGLAPGDE